ncbi:MFS transporter [Flavobacteriaceae bacterium]|nr:MFS transporter [Flavobacteriaceae bacterium]
MKSTETMSNFQKLIVALCFVLNFNDGIDIMLVSFSSPEIMAEWDLSKTQMGSIFSAALAGMTLGCFLIAPLADRIGRRKTFFLSLGLEIIGMLGIAFCESYPLLLFLRFLTGLGIGGLLPTMAATAAEFSTEKYRSFNVGLVQAGWPVGAILTGLFSAQYIPLYGWRSAFFIAALISVLMLLLVLFILTDSIAFLSQTRPPYALEKINRIRTKMQLAALEALPELEKDTVAIHYTSLFSKAYIGITWRSWLGVFFGFMTLYTVLSWVPTLANESGLSFGVSTYVGVTLNLGAAIGSSLIGYIGSKIGLQKTILSFMILAFMVMVLYGNLPLFSVIIFVLAFFIGLFVQGGFNGIWPFLTMVYPVEIRTTGIGFSVGFGRFGAILGPWLFGFLMDLGLPLSSLFFIFSLPLLMMGFSIWSIKKPQVLKNT